MSQGLIRVVCVGGPWDGFDQQDMPNTPGRRVQFPYSEKHALLTSVPELADPLSHTHMAIYQYDDEVSNDGILYCRHEQSITLEEWRRLNKEREDAECDDEYKHDYDDDEEDLPR